MKSKCLVKVAWLVGVAMILPGSTMVAQAAPSSGNTAAEARTAARLFRIIRGDAVQIHSAAIRLDRLTTSPEATWLDYDRQWNEIQPAVEDMQLKLARLETIQSAISPAERKELEQSKMLISGIHNLADQFRTLLDRPGTSTSDAKFKVYATSLRNVAGNLEKTAAVS